MKVITASTPDQQAYVKELVNELYETIFPYFFSREYIKKLKEFQLMKIPNLEELSLIEIMEVTAAIQTISTILEELAVTSNELEDYNEAFSRSASILCKYHIDFPFELIDFKSGVVSDEPKNQNSLYM